MNFKFKPIISILAALILFSCIGSIPSSKNEMKKKSPNWINNIPTSNQYWYGVGMSNKLDTSYYKLALQDATYEICPNKN